MWHNTTPRPNSICDVWMRILNGSEYKVLDVIVRYTLGWKDMNTLSERKERAWISNKVFLEMTNLSKGAVASAIQALYDKGAIEVFDEVGNLLDTPKKRKGRQRLYFKLKPELIPISTKFELDLSKKRTSLVQKMKYIK